MHEQFIHGSGLYRVHSYDELGGYIEPKREPEQQQFERRGADQRHRSCGIIRSLIHGDGRILHNVANSNALGERKFFFEELCYSVDNGNSRADAEHDVARVRQCLCWYGGDKVCDVDLERHGVSHDQF